MIRTKLKDISRKFKKRDLSEILEGSSTSGRVNELPNAHAAVIKASLFVATYCAEGALKVIVRSGFSTCVMTPDPFSEVTIAAESELADIEAPTVSGETAECFL